MSRILAGPCEAAIITGYARGAVRSMSTCGVHGVERPDLRPDRAVGEILCDEHYDAEKARRASGIQG